MGLRDAVIIDLDGTLCDTDHRKHFMEGSPKNWPAFYDGLVNDLPNTWCAALYDSLIKNKVHVIWVTGRPSNYRTLTEQWLDQWGFQRPYLYMRREGDFRKDSIVKVELYREFIEHNFNVLFCVDDRMQVVDAWREINLTCLQCAEGNF